MAAHSRREFRRQIGARLKALRRQAGISSQEDLAALAGVHRTYIGRLERGGSGVTVDTLATVLSAMSLSLAEFFKPFTDATKLKTPRQRE
jgi:transcriptional regulator with XRE-family HTH domain